ncbi:hypothetical protein EW146_g1675 [Bondarzewia mesenterica]|uniref:Uncharacterized protein n=1 Tax=Bondarzewia mesenterica TaxID=1095465 RepID=A0A4S4M349_9AGAM|nr:hypothetical protein EW146_g1675 [Bondarzewia mesenterica]
MEPRNPAKKVLGAHFATSDVVTHAECIYTGRLDETERINPRAHSRLTQHGIVVSVSSTRPRVPNAKHANTIVEHHRMTLKCRNMLMHAHDIRIAPDDFGVKIEFSAEVIVWVP